jgi:hypothetical protein
MTEEITFNKDGSGTYKFNMDMSALMDFANEMDTDSTETEKVYEKKDTLIYMKDLYEAYKDSINDLSEAEKEIFETMKDMKIHLMMDEEKSVFIMDALLDFSDIDELADMQRKIEYAQSMQENKGLESKPTNQKVTYHFNKKKFARNVEILKLSKEEQEAFDQEMESAKMFTSGTSYTIKYHFPYAIKSTSLENAKISNNGKTLEYETVMDSIIQNPKLLDFEVKF